jgi:hypothetical protein
MNLPEAPIAHEGFFATHFHCLKDSLEWRQVCPLLGGSVFVRIREGGFIGSLDNAEMHVSGLAEQPSRPTASSSRSLWRPFRHRFS